MIGTLIVWIITVILGGIIMPVSAEETHNWSYKGYFIDSYAHAVEAIVVSALCTLVFTWIMANAVARIIDGIASRYKRWYIERVVGFTWSNHAFNFALIGVVMIMLRKLFSRGRSIKESTKKNIIVSSGDAVVALVGASIFAAHGVKSAVVIKEAVSYVVGRLIPLCSGFGLFASIFSVDEDEPKYGLGYVKAVEEVCQDTLEKVSQKECSGKCKDGICLCNSNVEFVNLGLNKEKHEQRYPGLYKLWKDIGVRAEMMKIKVVAETQKLSLSFWLSVAIVSLAIILVSFYKYASSKKEGGKCCKPRAEAIPFVPKTVKPSLVSVDLIDPDSELEEPPSEKYSSPESKVCSECGGTFPKEAFRNHVLSHKRCDDVLASRLEALKESDDRRLIRERLDDRLHDKDIDHSRGTDDRSEGVRWRDLEEAEERRSHPRPDERPAGGKKNRKVALSFGMGGSKLEKKFFKESTLPDVNTCGCEEHSAGKHVCSEHSQSSTDALKSVIQLASVTAKESELKKVAKKRRVRSKPTRGEKAFSAEFKNAVAKEAGSFRISGLDSKGGVARVKGTEVWCNIVFACNHFILPYHLFSGAAGQVVEIFSPTGVVYEYKVEQGKKFSHDLIVFAFKSKNGELAPASLRLAKPDLSKKEIFVVSYVRFEDFATRTYCGTEGSLSQLELTKGKEMARYTAKTDKGYSGSMCLNEVQKCVGFHNEKGGFFPVTEELIKFLGPLN